MIDREETLRLFEKTQALLNGHFQLASGLHSAQYFQCALILQYPAYAEKLGRAIAEMFKGQKITCVVGPAIGGIIIGWEVARALGVKGIFAERVNGEMKLRRGFAVNPADKILVVEDVITTGGSAQEVVNLLKGSTSVLGVASIVNRSSVPPSFGVPYKSLLKMEIKTYEPATCPLCKEGRPIDKPGTKANVQPG